MGANRAEQRPRVAILLAALLAVACCTSDPTPPAASVSAMNSPSADPPAGPGSSPSLAPGIEARIQESIAIRAARGMRHDREWVIKAESQPGAAIGWGVRILPGEEPRVEDAALGWSIETRRALGYQADEPWVRRVILDPTSVLRMGSLLLMPDEASRYDAAIAASQDLARPIAAYGADHPDEWAGWYLDDGRPHVLVTGHAAEHEAALESLFALSVDLDVSEVRYSLAQLKHHRRELVGARFERWLRERDYDWEGTALSTRENAVLLELSTDRPGASESGVQEAVFQHLGGRPDWLQVRVEILPPIPDVGFGSLTVTVVDAAGQPVTEGWLNLVADIPRAITGGEYASRMLNRNGQARWDRVSATGYEVTVTSLTNTEVVLGSGHVEVPRDGEARLAIELTADP